MAQTSVTYQQYIQNENVFFSEQSKAAAFMNKNIIPSTRPFGRDISNYRLSSGPSDNFGLNTKEAQSYRNSLYNNGKYTDNEGDGVNDLSMADLPKSVREPLLASRELLSLKQNLEKQKSLPKYDSQSLRLQKVPLNLSTMENCDILEIKNPQFVSVYAKEIFDGLVAIEDKYYAKPSFLGKFQSEITERMRAVLIDWLVELHLKFKLSAETLYLTVNLVDRFLEKVQITKQKLQLVGIACMLIASKYQEIYPPEVKDFVNVSDRAYRKQEILDMEGQILCTLNFKLTIPSLYAFLERFSRVTSLDKKSFFLCQYILETILLDYSMLKYRPSLIVGGAIELASKVLRNKIPTDILLKSIKQNENALKSCCKDILGAIQNVEKGGLRVIHRKFMSSQFMEVSKIQLNL